MSDRTGRVATMTLRELKVLYAILLGLFVFVLAMAFIELLHGEAVRAIILSLAALVISRIGRPYATALRHHLDRP